MWRGLLLFKVEKHLAKLACVPKGQIGSADCDEEGGTGFSQNYVRRTELVTCLNRFIFKLFWCLCEDVSSLHKCCSFECPKCKIFTKTSTRNLRNQ